MTFFTELKSGFQNSHGSTEGKKKTQLVRDQKSHTGDIIPDLKICYRAIVTKQH